MIWKMQPDRTLLNDYPNEHMGQHLEIEVTEVGDDFITARMPVNGKTKQPFGILHGGASCVLAETLGSVAGSYCVDMKTEMVVGLEINANHLKAARDGFVIGTARPIHIGRTTHVWDIKITNEKLELVCVSRLTLAVRKLI